MAKCGTGDTLSSLVEENSYTSHMGDHRHMAVMLPTRTLLIATAILAFATRTHKAQAQAPGASVPAPRPEVSSPEQSGHYSLVGELGFYTGVAMGAQVALRHVGARATVGWNPILVTTSDPDTLAAESIHVFSTVQGNVDLFLLPLHGARNVRMGLLGSYKYNSLLGHGFGGGFEAQVAHSRRFGWHLTVGAVYYREGDERVSAEREVPQSNELNFPFGAGLQTGVSIGVLFYP